MYTQQLRTNHERRSLRLFQASPGPFHFALCRYWHFITTSPILHMLIEDIRSRYPDARAVADQIVNQRQAKANTNEIQNVALCSHVIEMCVYHPDQGIEIKVGSLYVQHIQQAVHLDRFRELFLAPFADYLDEMCEIPTTGVSIITRYKQKCEWFQRDRLFALWQSDPTRGEDALAFHLYEFLFDQAVPFSIEPRSISGRADLVAHQAGGMPFLADAKVFSDGTRKSYLATGIHQVYQYCEDYNYPIGYLVMFNVVQRDIHFDLPVDGVGLPYLFVNHKMIAVQVVDIYPVTITASKLGRLEPVQIDAKDLMTLEKR